MHSVAAIVCAVALLTATTGCGATREGPETDAGGGPGRMGGGAPPRGLGNVVTDASALYVRQGLLGASGAVPFVGRIAFFGSPSADSSLAVITVSLSARVLTFAREGDRYRAGYSVVADLKSQAGTRRVVEANEAVRVSSATETERNEESVIFQRFFSMPPGTYQLSITLRDMIGGRSSSYEGSVVVPNVRAQGMSTPLVVHQAELRSAFSSPPKLVASPRATGVFGRDSIFLTYVETYGNTQNTPVRYALVTETGATLWRDSITLTGSAQVASGLIRIPVTGVGGVGRLRLWWSGSRDTVQTPLFVGFGEDLPVASFSDMITYLRYYVNAPRLNAMRTAADDQKPAMWAALLRDTDPISSTPQHEGLLAYFERIRRANDLYRGEMGAGWLSDRGKVFVTLGEPDQIGAASGSEVFGRVRNLVWEYRRFALRLLFQDRTGLNRWELDPSSEAEFNAVAERERVG